MYAVIEDSGRQFKVEKNSEILIDLRDAEAGSDIVFDRILAVGGDDGTLKTDAKALAKCKVKGAVLGVAKGVKVVIGKFKRRKNMRRKTGHRQKYLRVRITDIAE